MSTELPRSIDGLNTVTENIRSHAEAALEAGNGLLRLAPCWVPRSFLQPGKRLKLDPNDLYAFGLNRGGIDERWFGSTTEAANEGRVWHEGLSFCSFEGETFLLKDAVDEAGTRVIGSAIYEKYNRWPVYSKFFDNMGPIPHHMHQGFEDAELVGLEGKPESYYFAMKTIAELERLRLSIIECNTSDLFRALKLTLSDGLRSEMYKAWNK